MSGMWSIAKDMKATLQIQGIHMLVKIFFPHTGILQRILKEDSIIFRTRKSEFPPTICLDLNLGSHFVLAHLYIKDIHHSP